MKKHFFITFCFFSIFKIFSQSIIVVDTLNKEPLSFVAIKFDNKGFYSSKEGEFNLNKIQSDFVEVSLLGYRKKNLKTENLKDSIFLKRDVYSLNEVELSKKQKISKIVKPLKSPKIFGSWVIKPETEILTSIYPTEDIKGYFINKINVYFSKVKEKKEIKHSDVEAYVRLHIYNIENEKPSNILYTSKPIKINSFEKEKLTLNISNSLISLSENGIFVGLELIGYYSKKLSNIKLDPIIRPMITNKTNKNFSSKTFIRYVFKNQYEIQSINDLLKKGTPKQKEISRNLNIGLELSK